MNGEQALAKIRSTIQQKIAETPAVQKLIDKINSGKATYADTALYARWAAINLGMCLSGAICEIDLNDRAAVCKALMLDQYRDINGFVDIVQSELDSRFGIQLAPQRAPFNKERADTIGHSLADTTKPDEVIERRAENAVANAVESMHDDRMQAESKFRSRLGLTVVIERTGANCCPWCAEVAGKYRYGDEPEGVFRRHDNCNCTIIYDSQVLRGAVGEDGRRTKTWEEVNPEKVRGFEPDVNTPEQAKEIEETALQGLTLPEKRDMIRNIRLDDIESAVQGTTISKDVADYIYQVLSEKRDQFKFDKVAVVDLDEKIVMQTDPVQNGTFYDIVLNLNRNFLGGKTVAELDAAMKKSKVTRADSFRDAIIHEIYHGKTYFGKNKGEIDALYEVLEGVQIDGISRTAYKDGFECLAEVGVLYERGETSDIPEKAKDLFFKYLGVKL